MTVRTKTKSCYGKMRHSTYDEAAEHRRRLIRQGSYAPHLRTYKCKECDWYHVGHWEKTGRRR